MLFNSKSTKIIKGKFQEIPNTPYPKNNVSKLDPLKCGGTLKMITSTVSSRRTTKTFLPAKTNSLAEIANAEQRS